MVWKDSVYDGLVVNDDIVPPGSPLLGPSNILKDLNIDCANDGCRADWLCFIRRL